MYQRKPEKISKDIRQCMIRTHDLPMNDRTVLCVLYTDAYMYTFSAGSNCSLTASAS